MLSKFFTNDSLLLLKVEPNNLRKALEIVQLFATALGSKCNIEKSRMISLIESNGFDYVGTGEIVGKGVDLLSSWSTLLYCAKPSF